MKKACSVIFLFTVFPCFIYAQNCDFTIDPGEDITLCEASSIQLNATASDTPLSVNWSPANLFTSPNGLSTTANITEPVTLSLTAEFLSDVNLVVNGNFDQGDTGFTSDYIYGTGGGVGLLSNEGQYAIADNAGDTHNHFDNCSDHTGGGNMMVVNASGLPNNIWCQTITVESNTNYDFSAWITSVTDENPAQLQFSINGGLIGNVFNASSSTCSWNQFAAQWNSGNTSSAEICIVNSNLTPNGNDFAMDDISFRQICEITEQIEVQFTTIDATWVNPGLFCEADDSQDLADWLSPTALTGGTWTINDIAATSFEPGLLGPGLHEVTYTATAGDCTTSFSQTLGIAPYFNAGQGETMSICQGEVQSVNLYDLLTDESPDGEWNEISSTPSSGNAFNAVEGTFSTYQQQSGIYQFEYSKEAIDPCPATAAIVTVHINELPIANAGEDQTIDCFNTTAVLGTTGPAPGIEYQWTLPTGEVLSNVGPTIEATIEGSYVLLATNTQTGCDATDATIVISNITEITLTADVTPIPCNQTDNGSITIESTSGGTAPYVYSIDGENFVASNLFSQLSAGDYTVTAMDANGCENSINVTIEPAPLLTVELDASLPGNPIEITAGDSLSIFVTTNINTDKIDTVLWTPEFAFCEGCMVLEIAPTSTTTYSVFISDDNGCVATDELTVIVSRDDDIFIPNAFSPNDDGFNDIFYIHAGKSIQKINEFLVMDRWGGLIYQNKDFSPNEISSGWNGKFKGDRVDTGVYVYYASIETSDGKVIRKSGEVTVVY